MLTASPINQQWLQQKWQTLTASVLAEPAVAEVVWAELSRHYSEAPRAYHNLSHIEAMLRRAESLREHIHHPATVEFAIWFHDVIYDTHLKDNEERSAEWARCAMIAMHIDEYHIPPVMECIAATAMHTSASSEITDLPLFLDIDLAILGADAGIYQAYSEAIRVEYAWVADDDYRHGRTRVIENFLERPALYCTPLMTTTFEARARHNLSTELRALHYT